MLAYQSPPLSPTHPGFVAVDKSPIMRCIFVLQHSPVQVVGEGGVGELQSYTSACTLLESGLAETLIFNLDWRGSLVAVNLAVRTEEAPYKVNLIIIYLILLPLSVEEMKSSLIYLIYQCFF